MSGAPLDFRNTNTLWCSVLVETLARCGVKHAVISPGSRSTPLTVALVRHGGIECLPVLDERSAGFFALGLAKQHRVPVVLVCTSGTAGANYFPAVIEAKESHVPLIILTADRPPEMRECASGQTIDQVRLFGNHVNWFHEIAVPEASLSLLGYLRQTIAHACDRAQRPSAGPIHLNAPFRDPLAPIEDESARAVGDALELKTFFDHLQVEDSPGFASTLWQRGTTGRGLIVAGADSPADPLRYTEAVISLSENLGWPILADVLSPLRHYSDSARIIAAYDAILRSRRAARELSPRTVLCLGGWPTSKVLRSWLESSGAEVALVSQNIDNRDALHGRTRHILGSVETLAGAGEGVRDDSYLRLWQGCERGAQSRLAEALATEEIVEPRTVIELAKRLPDGTPVVIANSMPIRDVEYVWPVNRRGLRLFFNRGANGIDGTLSTAFGVAQGNRPTVLLTGDLALLHDTNGFLHGAKFRGSLTIVLINNGGGGIFQHLPIAQFNPPFEEFFATPQKVDFPLLCAAYSVTHQVITDWQTLSGLLDHLPPSGVRVLELKTDRKRDVAFRKTMFAQAAAAAEESFSSR